MVWDRTLCVDPAGTGEARGDSGCDVRTEREPATQPGSFAEFDGEADTVADDSAVDGTEPVSRPRRSGDRPDAEPIGDRARWRGRPMPTRSPMVVAVAMGVAAVTLLLLGFVVQTVEAFAATGPDAILPSVTFRRQTPRP